MNMRTGIVTLLLGLAMGTTAVADEKEQPPADSSRLVAKTFEGLKLRSLGPALMSGRIADIAVHPRRQSTWYVAVGSGGLWKTTNAGTTWKAIFEDQGLTDVGKDQRLHVVFELLTTSRSSSPDSSLLLHVAVHCSGRLNSGQAATVVLKPGSEAYAKRIWRGRSGRIEGKSVDQRTVTGILDHLQAEL